mmetsp:Transcript_7873/g.26338  ORF Transcript_7873/g.26338 Transcript_7873/m.26338 type:complete len:214 (+) Transcript_7873:2031-2672(+)
MCSPLRASLSTAPATRESATACARTERSKAEMADFDIVVLLFLCASFKDPTAASTQSLRASRIVWSTFSLPNHRRRRRRTSTSPRISLLAADASKLRSISACAVALMMEEDNKLARELRALAGESLFGSSGAEESLLRISFLSSIRKLLAIKTLRKFSQFTSHEETILARSTTDLESNFTSSSTIFVKCPSTSCRRTLEPEKASAAMAIVCPW